MHSLGSSLLPRESCEREYGSLLWPSSLQKESAADGSKEALCSRWNLTWYGFYEASVLRPSLRSSSCWKYIPDLKTFTDDVLIASFCNLFHYLFNKSRCQMYSFFFNLNPQMLIFLHLVPSWEKKQLATSEVFSPLSTPRIVCHLLGVFRSFSLYLWVKLRLELSTQVYHQAIRLLLSPPPSQAIFCFFFMGNGTHSYTVHLVYLCSCQLPESRDCRTPLCISCNT